MNISLWNSPDALTKFVYFVDYACPAVEAIIAVIGLRNSRNETSEHRRNRREKTLLVLALVAALFWGADAKLNHRLYELQEAESSRTITKIDPRKRPIETVSASVRLVLKESATDNSVRNVEGTCFLGFVLRGQDEAMLLTLGTSEMKIWHGAWLLNFNSALPMNDFSPGGTNSAERSIESIDRCKLFVAALKPEILPNGNPLPQLEITGGEALLTLNSLVQKRFMFPPQKPKNPDFTGFDAVTNFPSTAPK